MILHIITIEEIPEKGGMQIFTSLKATKPPTANEDKALREINQRVGKVLTEYFAECAAKKGGQIMETDIAHGHVIDERVSKLRGEG